MWPMSTVSRHQPPGDVPSRSTGLDEVSMSSSAVQDHLDRIVRTWIGLSASSEVPLQRLPDRLARLLLRIEEYGPPYGPLRQGGFGRWEFSYSDNFHRGQLWVPEVDEWVSDHRRDLARELDLEPLWPNGHKFAVCLTHDVDMVSRQVSPRQALRGIRTAFKHDDNGYRSRALRVGKAAGRSIYFGLSRLPSAAATLEKCVEMELELGVRSSYFFTVAPIHPDDCVYTLNDACSFQNRRRTVAAVARSFADEGFDVGLHGSYLSATAEGFLAREKAALEGATGHDVLTIRQHYLNFDPRVTPRLQDTANLRADCTLGFNRNLGFRAGTSLPFRLFDFESDTSCRVLEVPLIIQEAALLRRNSLALDVDLAKKVVRQLCDTIEAVNGVVTVLFHPHSLLDLRYRELYRFVIEYCLARGAWITSLTAVSNWWHARESRLGLVGEKNDVSVP
jgi:hypothetical protein